LGESELWLMNFVLLPTRVASTMVVCDRVAR